MKEKITKKFGNGLASVLQNPEATRTLKQVLGGVAGLMGKEVDPEKASVKDISSQLREGFLGDQTNEALFTNAMDALNTKERLIIDNWMEKCLSNPQEKMFRDTIAAKTRVRVTTSISHSLDDAAISAAITLEFITDLPGDKERTMVAEKEGLINPRWISEEGDKKIEEAQENFVAKTDQFFREASDSMKNLTEKIRQKRLENKARRKNKGGF